MSNLTARVVQGTAQFIVHAILVFSLFLVPSLLVAAILSGLGAA
ncbi:hypothetical protein [Arthrobacter sp. UYEF21]